MKCPHCKKEFKHRVTQEIIDRVHAILAEPYTPSARAIEMRLLKEGYAISYTTVWKIIRGEIVRGEPKP